MSTAVKSRGLAVLGPMHESFARLTGWRAHGVATLLGAVAALAFAPFHLTPILIFSFTGLIWMIDGARGHRRWGRAVFARGWAFGYGFLLISLYWTASAFLVNPAEHAVFLFIPFLMLPGGLALWWGLGAALAGSFWSSSPSRIFVFTLFFGLAEWLRGHVFGGFPWNLPATTWIPGGAVSQAASLGGVYWLTLLTVFAVASPAALVDTRETKELGGRLAPTLGAVVVLALGWAWGAQRIAEPAAPTDQMVTLMDVGVPQKVKTPENADLVLRRYLELLAANPNEPGELVIWPEGAVPLPLLRTPNAIDAVAAYLGEAYLVAGTVRWEVYGRTFPVAYNSLAVLNRDSARSGPVSLYDKHRLVPLGELAAVKILPFGELFAGVLPSSLQRNLQQGFEPGPGPKTVYAGDAPPFAAMICYEGLFPEIPTGAKPPAEWLVVISNDAWFGSGMGPAQHYVQNRFRSIETGLPMARVASRSATAVIDGRGREVARGRIQPGDPEGWRSSVVRAALPEREASTLFQRLGDSLFWLSIALLSLLAFLSWRR